MVETESMEGMGYLRTQWFDSREGISSVGLLEFWPRTDDRYDLGRNTGRAISGGADGR